MTRTWTSMGRSLAGLGLAMILSACSTIHGLSVGAPWPGSALFDDRTAGSHGSRDETTRPAFVGLYQTSQGPMLYREGKLYTLGASGLMEWGSAPRADMAWAIALVSPNEAWSVGEEGIARFQDGRWEPVVNRSHEALDPAATGGQAAALTDVAFAGATTGYAVGTYGTVLKYDGSDWARVAHPAFAGKHFGTVRIAGDGKVWVAGEDVFCFDGTDWKRFGLPEPEAAVGGLLILSDGLWASTGDGLWHLNPSTGLWSEPQPDLIEGFVGPPQAVPDPAGSVLAYAMDVGTPDGTLYRLDREGAWSKVALKIPAEIGLDALAVLDAQTGFALSFDGAALYRFQDEAWSAVSFKE